MSAFEEEFALEISDEDAERMKKVKDVIAYLEKSWQLERMIDK